MPVHRFFSGRALVLLAIAVATIAPGAVAQCGKTVFSQDFSQYKGSYKYVSNDLISAHNRQTTADAACQLRTAGIVPPNIIQMALANPRRTTILALGGMWPNHTSDVRCRKYSPEQAKDDFPGTGHTRGIDERSHVGAGTLRTYHPKGAGLVWSSSGYRRKVR